MPTETWREHVARRQRHAEVWEKLVDGEISSIDDLITLNLDIHQFAVDAIAECEGPETLRGFWRAIETISVLDPTCGSGAFLFAALNILQPLAEACLERMQAFVDESDRGEERPHPERFKDFRKTLEDVARHPNREYFVLKQIVLNNLHGVDIMEEAVEICKLRLFLKLVAQVETAEQIEPLPDIDFNIRAGNTLVGFSSLTEVERALSEAGAGQLRMLDAETSAEIARMKEEAEKASMAFATFHELQADGNDPSLQRAAKRSVRTRLSSLRQELDRLLARVYGLSPDSHAYPEWRVRHDPFHWITEFYEIIHDDGGFDVILGNPPYVARKKIEYDVPDPTGRPFPDIYANVLIRSLAIARSGGRLSMIVPLSLTFGQDYVGLRSSLLERRRGWFSSYDILPSPLFSGVAQRCTIWVSGSEAQAEDAFSTRTYRWRSINRESLFENLNYVRFRKFGTCSEDIPKHPDEFSVRVLSKIEAMSCRDGKESFFQRSNSTSIRYKSAALNFVSAFVTDPPCLSGISLESVRQSMVSEVPLQSHDLAFSAMGCLNGELHFWYWLIRGDGFHVTSTLMKDFLVSLAHLDASSLKALSVVGAELDRRRFEALVFKHHAGMYVGNFNYQKLQPITRRGDLILASALQIPRDDIIAIFDYVERVRSINVFAGEKAIPSVIKEMFDTDRVSNIDGAEDLRYIDDLICGSYGFSEHELDALLSSTGTIDCSNLS